MIINMLRLMYSVVF